MFHSMPRMISTISLAAALSLVSSAQAATQYFDGDGATAGQPAPNSGTWDSTTANWNDASDFTGTYAVWGSDVARFDSSGTATITVDGTVNVNELINGSGNQNYFGGTINLTGAALVTRTGGGGISFTSDISGTNGMTIQGGAGINMLGTTKSFTGNVTLAGSAVLRILAAETLPSDSQVVFNAANSTLDVRADQTLAGLSGTENGSVQRANGGTGILNLNSASGTLTYNGRLNHNFGHVHVVKQGGYTQVIAGADASISRGPVTVEGGVLALAKTAGVDALGSGESIVATNGTGMITITAGTLRLDNAEQINDTNDMTLGGGTFDLNDNNETLGDLIVSATSTLAFNGTDAIVSFASLDVTGGTLSITGWDGNATGGGADQLIFTADPSAFLASFDFGGELVAAVVDNGGNYEVVGVIPAVPEPASLALVGIAGMMILSRRQRS